MFLYWKVRNQDETALEDQLVRSTTSWSLLQHLLPFIMWDLTFVPFNDGKKPQSQITHVVVVTAAGHKLGQYYILKILNFTLSSVVVGDNKGGESFLDQHWLVKSDLFQVSLFAHFLTDYLLCSYQWINFIFQFSV